MNQHARRIASCFPLGVLTLLAAACTAASQGREGPDLPVEPVRVAPEFVPMTVLTLPGISDPHEPLDAGVELSGRQVAVRDVLAALFSASDLNLLVDDAVQGDVTFDVKAVSAERAFEILMQHFDLAWEPGAGTVRVTPLQRRTFEVDLLHRIDNQLERERGQDAQRLAAWQQLTTDLQGLVDERSTVVVNPIAGTVTVEAAPSSVALVGEYLAGLLRRATHQVSIEARVLEVRLRDEFRFGVRWSLLGDLLPSELSGTLPGGAFVSQIAGASGDAIQVGLENADSFQLFLEALEAQGQVRVLSSPRVTTMNNVPATFRVVDDLPVIERDVLATQGGVITQYDVRYEQAGMTLTVVPQIGSDGKITAWIKPSVREQIGTVITPDGLQIEPVLSTREAETTIRVADGSTIVIGGLRDTRKTETLSGVPWLSRLPLVGQLFHSTVQEREEVELVVLLVPRVLDALVQDRDVGLSATRLISARRPFASSSLDLDARPLESWSGGPLANGGPPSLPRATVPLPSAGGPTAGVLSRSGLARHLLVRGAEALAEQRTAEATSLLDRATTLAPEDADACLYAGAAALLRGDLARARRQFERALARRPDDPQARTALGLTELQDGAPQAAIPHLRAAFQLTGGVLEASNLAAALIASGRPQSAAGLLQALDLEAQPDPEPHANLAFVELRAGRLALGEEQLDKALAKGARPRSASMRALAYGVAHPADLSRQAGTARAESAAAPR